MDASGFKWIIRYTGAITSLSTCDIVLGMSRQHSRCLREALRHVPGMSCQQPRDTTPNRWALKHGGLSRGIPWQKLEMAGSSRTTFRDIVNHDVEAGQPAYISLYALKCAPNVGVTS